jgi:hypothetical protein
MLKKALTCAAVAIVIASVAPGCSDPEPATPQVIIESEALSPGGSDGSQKCQVTGSWLNIGTFADITDAGTDPKPKPVPNGSTEPTGKVDISCKVEPKGDGFDVALSATISGADGGTITIVGQMKPNKQEKQTGIRVTFSKRDRGSFIQPDCEVDYNVNRDAGIAAGRVWGEVRCGAAKDDNLDRTCAFRAQFRFENCSQAPPQ